MVALLVACQNAPEPWLRATQECDAPDDATLLVDGSIWSGRLPFDQACAEALTGLYGLTDLPDSSLSSADWTVDTPTMTASALWFLAHADLGTIRDWRGDPGAPWGLASEFWWQERAWGLSDDDPASRLVFDWVVSSPTSVEVSDTLVLPVWSYPEQHLRLPRRPGTSSPWRWATVIVHETAHAGFRPHVDCGGNGDPSFDNAWNGAYAFELFAMVQMTRHQALTYDVDDELNRVATEGFCDADVVPEELSW